MLTRFVRTQLIIFTIAGVVGMATMVFGYLQVLTWIGVGRITVTVELKGTGGLYRFGNVTYRGVQIGKVASVEPTATGAEAVLTLDDSPQIPANVRANVRSVSAVGEQYVDLIPTADGPPFLVDGSVIKRDDTTIPQKVGPMLDQLQALVSSVPKNKLSDLLDESFRAFNGAGYDVGSLLDSGSRLAADANATAERTRLLIDDVAPLLNSQAQTTEALGTWTHHLNGVTEQLVENDPDLRHVLHAGPAAAQQVSQLLTQLKPTLPVLLANMTTVGQVGVTYNPSLRQVFFLLPPFVAGLSSLSGMNNVTGYSLGAFSLMANDPPPCTVGFLPPSQWRSPADETVVDTPDNLYCKLPQDSPIAVRGARNFPCLGHPGKRAPTAEICDSDKPYMPLALRQHALGPYPFDPNTVTQGIPPDSRIDESKDIYGPLDGTPLPPQQAGAGAPDQALPGAPAVVPNSFTGGVGAAPASAAVANYDPRSGRYIGADGLAYRQTNLTNPGSAPGWRDMLAH